VDGVECRAVPSARAARGVWRSELNAVALHLRQNQDGRPPRTSSLAEGPLSLVPRLASFPLWPLRGDGASNVARKAFPPAFGAWLFPCPDLEQRDPGAKNCGNL